MKRGITAGKDKSQVLISAIFILATVVVLGTVFLFRARALRNISARQFDTDRAYSLAKSGLGLGKNLIPAPSPCTPSTVRNVFTVSPGNLITIDINTTAGTITSRGKSAYSNRVLEKKFTPQPGGGAINGWFKVYGNYSDANVLTALHNLSDGFIFGGKTYPYGTSNPPDYLAIRTDVSGNPIWSMGYGNATRNETFTSLDYNMSSNEFILGGTSDYGAADNRTDFLVVRTNSTGNITWAKRYGGSQQENLCALQQTTGGGYILGGDGESFQGVSGNSFDFILIRTDADGNVGPTFPLTWVRVYRAQGVQRLYSLQQTSDGGYVAAGYTSHVGSYQARGQWGLFVLRVDSTGARRWARTYDGRDWEPAYEAVAINQTTDGGFIIGCGSKSFTEVLYNDPNDYLVIKTDGDGRVGTGAQFGITTWAKGYGAENRTDGVQYTGDELRALQQTSDGGYILAGGAGHGGSSYSYWEGAFTAKINNLGNILWARAYWDKDYGMSNINEIRALQATSAGFIFGGEALFYNEPTYKTYRGFLALRTNTTGDADCCVNLNVTSQMNRTDITIGSGDTQLNITNVSLSVTPVDPIACATSWHFGPAPSDFTVYQYNGSYGSACPILTQ